MRRLTVALRLAAAAVVALAPAEALAREPRPEPAEAARGKPRPLALVPARYAGPEDAVSCADFLRWEDAQAFYDSAAPTDPYGLDPDSDGVACEGLRGGSDD